MQEQRVLQVADGIVFELFLQNFVQLLSYACFKSPKGVLILNWPLDVHM